MQGEDTYVDAQAEALSSAIDDTYESRASTREKAWERIVALLRNNVRLDDCYQRCVLKFQLQLGVCCWVVVGNEVGCTSERRGSGGVGGRWGAR